jgi:hypothetical protein
LEHESEFPALKVETGRVAYLVFFYLDSASHPIPFRDAMRVEQASHRDETVEFEVDGTQFGSVEVPIRGVALAMYEVSYRLSLYPA